MEMHMSINQHHARFLRKKQNDILNKKLEPPTMWVYHWLHSTSSLLNAGIPTDHVFDLAQNLFEPYESNAKNIGNIYIALTTLTAVTSNRSINDLYSIKGFDCKKEISSLLQLLKNKDNTYKMYEHGETDVRSVYCAIAVSKYIGIEIAIPIDFLLSCQSYDGGFSGIPDTESHAGFTYCAVASLAISKELQRCNMIQLIGWLACRAENENGRISKESDSCYAYWIGATVKILEINGFVNAELRDSIFDSLYAYVMRCEEKWGGFSDKIGGKSDLQHTAYALFFLSLNDKYNSFIYTINPLYGFVERK